jgi:FkbM family methyltransferase
MYRTPDRSLRHYGQRLYRLVFARKIFRPLNEFLYECSGRGLGIDNSGTPRITGEKAFLESFLKNRRNPVVVDVGAHRGEYAALVKRFAPDATVFCFEPHPKTYRELVKALSGMAGVHLANMACGNEAGKATLYDHADFDSSPQASLYQNVFEESFAVDYVQHEIEVTTLDTWAEENRVENIDLLKIDTEGWEMNVLRGASKLLERGDIEAIHFEFNWHNVEGRVFMRDFARTLASFHLFRMVPDGLMPLGAYDPKKWEIFAFQNIVAVKR